MIILLRHCESSDVAAGVLGGWRDDALTPRGRAQALKIGEWFRGGPLEDGFPDIDLVVTSPLFRAQETASLITGVLGLPQDRLRVVANLTERYMGSAEGWPKAAAYSMWPGREYPGAESLDHVYRRALHAIAQYVPGPYFDSDEVSCLIVTHKNVIRELTGGLSAGASLEPGEWEPWQASSSPRT